MVSPIRHGLGQLIAQTEEPPFAVLHVVFFRNSCSFVPSQNMNFAILQGLFFTLSGRDCFQKAMASSIMHGCWLFIAQLNNSDMYRYPRQLFWKFVYIFSKKKVLSLAISCLTFNTAFENRPYFRSCSSRL